jgi:hypothetical protein
MPGEPEGRISRGLYRLLAPAVLVPFVRVGDDGMAPLTHTARGRGSGIGGRLHSPTSPGGHRHESGVDELLTRECHVRGLDRASAADGADKALRFTIPRASMDLSANASLEARVRFFKVSQMPGEDPAAAERDVDTQPHVAFGRVVPGECEVCSSNRRSDSEPASNSMSPPRLSGGCAGLLAP